VSDGYFRNQGVGSWEINLAAFLTDLDPNQWDTSTDPYTYLQPANGNTGRGFEDALSLLSYRYGYNYNSLTNAAALLNGAPGLANGNIDSYSYGPLMTTPAGITVSQNVSLWPWVGADNTNHFFTPEELFNPNESSTLFVNSLLAAGATNNIYENYTFYRLLSQLGTDSTPDSGKMNINYDNIDLTNGVASSTNFMSWQPLAFFTNAADRLLRAYTTEWRNGNPANFANTFYSVSDFSPMFSNPSLWTNYPAFGIGHIPVLVSNRFVYASAVNRLPQLAANMYDATANRAYLGAATYPYLPTVFQPIFMVTNGNVYITNFIEVTNTSFLATPPSNLGYGPSVVSNLSQYPNSLVFGVPLIIGAKKGLPNFNEFALESAFTLTRKLQATRTTTNAPDSSYQLNQMFNLSVNNQLGVECWNSYSNNYTRPVTIMVNDYLVMGLTNDENYSTNTGMTLTNSLIPLPIQPWQGYKDPQFSSAAALSFRTPLNANIAFVPTSTYRYNGGNPYLTTNLNLPFETNGSSYLQPHWGMTLTNLLQVAMVDVNSGRIIDYVQLSGPNSIRDLSAEIQQWCDNPAANNAYLDLWDTNLTNGVPMGVGNQISVSLGINPAINPSYWKDPTSATNEVNGTRAFFHVNELPGSPKSSASYYAAGLNSLSNEIAYTTPPATVVLHVTWQANDPLVHYLAGDLAGGPYNETDITPYWPWPPTIPNDRYRPWGVAGADSQNAYNSALKDPLMRTTGISRRTNSRRSAGWAASIAARRGRPSISRRRTFWPRLIPPIPVLASTLGRTGPVMPTSRTPPTTHRCRIGCCSTCSPPRSTTMPRAERFR
jgi:hypothetical protein